LWLPTLSLSYCPPADADHLRLCDHGASGGGLVLPVGGQDTDGPVVAGETVDTGLDQNEAELGVLVLAVALEVLADGDGLLDEHVKVLGDLGSEAYANLSVSLNRTEALRDIESQMYVV